MQCDQCLSKVKIFQSYLWFKNASGLFISPCKMLWSMTFFLHGDMINPVVFLDQRCHYAYTPMPNRVEKGEQTGKCCDESRLFLKTLLFSPAIIKNPVKISLLSSQHFPACSLFYPFGCCGVHFMSYCVNFQCHRMKNHIWFVIFQHWKYKLLQNKMCLKKYFGFNVQTHTIARCSTSQL